MLDLGELLLHIKADTSEVESSVSGIGDKLKSGLSGAASAVVGAVTAATAAVGAFAASSVNVGMNFDSAMSQVAATMGKTTGEIGQLRDFALEMGSKTAFSATQAAEALNYMALAGYDADESMKMLPNVLNLAAAGGMDLARASDMVTDAQSALGLTMEETTVMVDQMAKTSSTTNTSVAQLGDAILRIGATGKTVKGGTAELSQVLGLLADNGIKGAEGGTKLRNVIMSLQTPTDKGTLALKNLGIQAYDSEGNFRSLADIMPEMSNALDDLTMEQRQAAISAIFNKTDIAAVNALLETTPDRWDEVATAIDNAKDSAEKMANTQLDNLAGDITLFKSALEGAQIAVSDALTPTLREFVQFGTDAITKLSDAFKDGGLTGAMEALGTILSEGLNMVISKLPDMVDAGMKLLGALGQGLLDNIGTITEAAIKIVSMLADGIISALPSLAKGTVQVVSTLGKYIVEALPELGQAALQIVTMLLQFVVDNASQMGQGAGELIGQLASGIGQALPQLLPMAVQAITEFLVGLTSPESIDSLINGAADLIGGLVEGLIQAIPILLDAAPKIIAGLVQAIVEAIPKIIKLGVQILAGLLKGITDAISKIPACIKAVFDGIVNGIKSLFGIHSPSTVMAEIGGNVIAGMLKGITETWSKITDFFSGAIEGVVSFVSEGWETLKTKTGEAWETIKEKTGELKEDITEKWEEAKKNVTEKAEELVKNAKEKWEDMKKTVSDKTEELKKNVSDKWEEAKKNVTDKVEELKKNVQEKTEELKQKATEKWEELRGNVTEKAKELAEKGKEKFEELRSNVTDKMEEVRSNVEDKWEQATDALKQVDLKQIGSDIIGNFKTGLEKAWTSVTTWVSGAAKSIKDTISGAISWVSSKVSGKHRTGLNEVPFDGYVAELHRGERVLTAAEANQYDQFRRGTQNTSAQPQTIIKFEGNYNFRDQNDIDYFMTEAGKMIRRKVG